MTFRLDKLLASPSDGVYEVQVVGVTSPTEEDQELLSQVLQRLCGPSLKILRLINSPLSPPLHHQLNLFLTIYACVEELEVSFSGGFRTLADIAASACVKPELHTLILRGSGGFDTESGQKLLSGCRGRTFPERTLIEGSGRPEQVTERPMVLGANEMVRATNQMRVVRWNYDAEGRPALFLRTDLWREDSVPRSVLTLS